MSILCGLLGSTLPGPCTDSGVGLCSVWHPGEQQAQNQGGQAPVLSPFLSQGMLNIVLSFLTKASSWRYPATAPLSPSFPHTPEVYPSSHYCLLQFKLFTACAKHHGDQKQAAPFLTEVSWKLPSKSLCHMKHSYCNQYSTAGFLSL